MKIDLLSIYFFLGTSENNPKVSSRLTEIDFVVLIIGCSIDSMFDESIDVISINLIDKLDVANNKIVIKDRRILN